MYQTTPQVIVILVLYHKERIRNTLSHEMCHLACWVIDGCPKEGHGQLFKAWYVCFTVGGAVG